MRYAVVAGQGIVGDTVGTGGVNHLSIAYINAYMRDVYIVAGKENQIAGHELGLAYRAAGCGLNVSRAGQVNALLCKDVLDKAGAVKTVGRRTSPNIGDAQKLLSQVNNAVSAGKVGLMVGDNRHRTVEKCLIGIAADFAIDIQMIVFLEFRYSSFGCRTIITVHDYIIAAAGQSLLDFDNVASRIPKMEAGSLCNVCVCSA